MSFSIQNARPPSTMHYINLLDATIPWLNSFAYILFSVAASQSAFESFLPFSTNTLRFTEATLKFSAQLITTFTAVNAIFGLRQLSPLHEALTKLENETNIEDFHRTQVYLAMKDCPRTYFKLQRLAPCTKYDVIKIGIILLATLASTIATSCAAIPQHYEPVAGFSVTAIPMLWSSFVYHQAKKEARSIVNKTNKKLSHTDKTP